MYLSLNLMKHTTLTTLLRFFLKASIIGRKKEAAAEKLQEAMDEVGYSEN